MSRILVAGRWFLVAGRWLLVSCHLSLVAGNEWLIKLIKLTAGWSVSQID